MGRRSQFTAKRFTVLPTDDGLRAAFQVADSDLALWVALLQKYAGF